MKELGLKLLRAESEAEVSAIIEADPRMSDGANWKPIDNRETNFNTVTNQQSTGGKAATELITNMVDAMLMKCCLEKGIDPKGTEAPRTMYEAVELIRKMGGGRIVNADEKWLREYAERNLVIGTTGGKDSKNKPCYTFADNGEGQYPEDFSNTFLSLSAKNKSEIPFVQGKYNMGSSGVLSFCGEKWFKFIASRRYDKRKKWGWTLIRKRPSQANKISIAEYFAPDGGKIPILESVDELHPFQIRGKSFDGFSLETGTVIKLYDFYLGKNFSGFRASREAFNENLVETILPFRILDFRWKPDPARSGLRKLGIDERPFYGMEFLLRRPHMKDAEQIQSLPEEELVQAETQDILDIGTITTHALGRISIRAIPIKAQSSRSNWFLKSKSRVFHHVNGQVQFKQQRGFLSQQCGLPALMDRVIVLVDASEVKDDVRTEIWKGDREQILETPRGEDYKEEIKKAISKADALKALNDRIAKEEIDSASKSAPLELAEGLVRKDSNLALLLDDSHPGVSTSSKTAKKVSLVKHQYSPTFVQIKKPLEFNVPINKPRPIGCLTDAAIDYFQRTENRGDLFFYPDEISRQFRCRRILDDIGNLTVFLTPEADYVKVGDEYKFKIGLKDAALPVAVFSKEEIHLKIVDQVQPEPKPNPRPRSKRPETSQRGLPRPILLTRDGREVGGSKSEKWDSIDLENFNEHDGGYIKDYGDQGKIYYVNFDNAFFQSYLKTQKGDGAKAAAEQKYILGMQVALLGMEYALAHANVKKDENFDPDLFRRMAAKGAADVAMTLCSHLPRLFERDDQDDE